MTSNRTFIPRRWLVPGVALALATATILLFEPAMKHEFLVYDDYDYVAGNTMVQHGLTPATVSWALRTGHASNWHPTTWLSHALDCQVYGLQPAGHHFTNILLHAVNAALLLLLLNRWTGNLGRSALASAVFAFHPLRVESVAWVSERKDLLSGFFFFLTLLAYTKYVNECRIHSPSLRSNTTSSPKPKTWYVATLAFFTLGLMSKPMLVTVPFLFLLLDAWPLGRWSPFTGNWKPALGKLFPEKIPFFLLAAGSCVITYHAQQAGGALRDFSLADRVGNAFLSYIKYVGSFFYPRDLAVIYPFQPVSPAVSLVAAAAFLGICVIALRTAQRRPEVFVGWFWFVGMLVPVIGLVQVGNQAMADRYTYLPGIGLTLLVVWGAAEISRRLSLPIGLRYGVAIGSLAGCLMLTRAYLPAWRTTIHLFEHAVAITGSHTVALRNLGIAYKQKGQLTEARLLFEQTLAIEPNDPATLFNLGGVLLLQGNTDEALIPLRRAVDRKIHPHEAIAFANMGLMLAEARKPADALLFYRKALEGNPDSIEALNNLAWLLATAPEDQLRNGSEAVRCATKACALTAERVPLLIGTLAAAHAEAGQFDQAVLSAEKACHLARESKQDDVAKRNAELWKLYRTGKPFREK